MIVTTGRIIKVDTGGFRFERSSEAPGAVYLTVTRDLLGEKVGTTMTLPANAQEVERFIEAYRRVVSEEVGYRKMENE